MRSDENEPNLLRTIRPYLEKPELYAPGTTPLWDDDHISKGMLAAHLDPDWEAATRSHAFVDQSVRWIASVAPPSSHPKLLDLGCGPGLYAERFARAGYDVTGIDFSRRSIAYARQQAQDHDLDIQFVHQNYLTLEVEAAFDVVTLIYCDYAVLSKRDREQLVARVFRALTPGGVFIVDVFTPKRRREESTTWSFHEQGGFFSPEPHLLLSAVHQYDDDDRTELARSVIVTDRSVETVHVWDHFFTAKELEAEVMAAGFSRQMVFDDVAGVAYSGTSDTVCGVFWK